MGTIITRKRTDGKPSYLAQIVRRQGNKVARENRTFRELKVAKAWIRQRESELDNPQAFKAATAPSRTLDDAIERYIAEQGDAIGKSKAVCLSTIRRHAIVKMNCADIGSTDIVAFARSIGAATGLANPGPATVQNYLSNLQSVFSIAKIAWGYPLDPQAMKDAMFVLRKQRAIAKSNRRDRRPTLKELDRLLDHFTDLAIRSPGNAPMADITLFALFSARRMEEITRIRWDDFEPATNKHSARVLVRDLKHPGAKKGNNVYCELPPEAEAVIKRQPRNGEHIFPHGVDGIGAAFTRACRILGIDDLHFHDLRHEGVSRLFEAGWNIPHVALVSGHRSWASLQRYAHLRQRDDKFSGWRWRP
jgi:integrase